MKRSRNGRIGWAGGLGASGAGEAFGEAECAAILAAFRLNRAAILAEHLQHSIGDEESADDVARRADDGDEAENRGDGVVVVAGAGGDDRSDERDAGDRVRRGHQWGVKQRWDPLDHHEADEAGEDEDVEFEEKHDWRVDWVVVLVGWFWGKSLVRES